MDLSEYNKIYRDIGSVQCPYFFNESVYFNQKGFNHLLRNKNGVRPSSDQIRRLRLLIYCKEILNSNNFDVECNISKRNGVTTRFWTFKASVANLKMKLIVRQIGIGTKHFYSIFPIKH